MKKFAKTQLLTAVCALGCAYQSANAQFTLSGQYKPRTEFRHGFKTPLGVKQDPAVFTEHRARMIANYSTEKYVFRLSIQDVRTWGATGQINKSDGLFSAHEAWAKYLFNPNLSMTVGRQEIVFDDARIWGNLDWAMQGRSHDGVRLTYADSTWELNVIGTWNQVGVEPGQLTAQPYVSGAPTFNQLGGGLPNAKTFQLAHFNKTFDKSNVSLQFLNHGTQIADTIHTKFMQMAGANANLVFGDFKISPTAYYQFGNSANASTTSSAGNTTVSKTSDIKKSAYMFHLDVSYNGLEKYKPTIGFDYLSGQNDSSKTKDEDFEVLYGTHHLFYGLMDYFYVGSAHKGRGLFNPYFKNKFIVNEKLTLGADLHYFMAASDVKVVENGETKTKSKGLGAEIDLTATYKMNGGVTLMGGYSQMFSTESMNAVKGFNEAALGKKHGFQNWTWVMLVFTPKFI